MPNGYFNESTLLNADKIDYAYTISYNHFAKNHCGAVSILNLVLYFNYEKKDLIINNKHNTFNEIYKRVGDGPVLFLSSKIKTYFKSRSYCIKSKKIYSYSSIKNSIYNNEPVIVLLMKNLFSFHWVNVVGYQEYLKGDKYLNVVDNWNPTINRYYKINDQSKIIVISKYFLK